MTDWTLITFDVDGTLLKSHGDNPNRAHVDAFKTASEKVFGVGAKDAFLRAWWKRPTNGATDGIVVLLVGDELGIAQNEIHLKVVDYFKAMEEAYDADTGNRLDGISPIPGVMECLTKLDSTERVAFGLVTGNVENIGWGKMGALNYPLGPQKKLKGGFGGFGSDVLPGGTNPENFGNDRGKQILAGLKKAEGFLPEGHSFTKRFHVGDTDADIKAAYYAEFVPIGVCTGKQTKAELQEFIGDKKGVVVDNLNSEEFWKTVEL